MTLERFVHQIESGLLKLGNILQPTSRRAVLEEEADDLVAELQKYHTDMKAAERERDETQARLGDHEARVALLPSQIEGALYKGAGGDAYGHAMELERVREQLTADRAALPRLEQRVWSLQFLIRQIERRLARVQNQLNAPTRRG